MAVTGCWERHPRGRTLIKGSSSGHFFASLLVAADPHFTCGLAATLLSLPVAPSDALKVLTWLALLLTGLASRHPSPTVSELFGTITGVMLAPTKMAVRSSGYQRKNFLR